MTPDTVVTARQIVTGRAGRPRARLYADFPEAPASPRIAAVASFPAGSGDLAVLTLASPAPVPPARVIVPAGEVWVRIFVYPQDYPTGVWLSAMVSSVRDPAGRWRLRCPGGTAIEPGFGGAGVHDDMGKVLGMVVVDLAASGRPEAWMIPGAALPRAPAGIPAGVPARWAMGETGAPLTFADKQALAKALGEVPVLADPGSRRLIVQNLPLNIRSAVPNHPVAGLDLFGLVDAVLAFDEGFSALYSVIVAFAGEDALSVARVRMLATRLGLLAGT